MDEKGIKGHNIFISYKFADDSVYQTVDHQLFEAIIGEKITPHNYMLVLGKYLDNYSYHNCKAEDEDISHKSDDQIYEYLKDKMFKTSITILLISPKMKDDKPEKDQWIPWEISYSLGNETRKSSSGKLIRSCSNGIFAIVLPDTNNSYLYYFKNPNCKVTCDNPCIIHNIGMLFSIVRNNMFNKNECSTRICNNKSTIHDIADSYIRIYKWDEVNTKEKLELAIKKANERKELIDEYTIKHQF